ncbi:MAG TPA: hypothetical protein VMH85_06440, partial [Terriglobales bacterium]|nr:hypothetical protein [Terriglobales bacterium]
DINTKYQAALSPSIQDIENLANLRPTGDPNVTYPASDYTITPDITTDSSNNQVLNTGWGTISAGPYKDLYASILGINLQATAQRNLGDQVTMQRRVEVAMIPVFQFGVFSDSDLGFYSSPNLDFNGRVHTNGNLFLGVANCCTITFHDKLTAYGEVVRKQLPNGLDASSNNDSGTVLIPTAASGCDGSKPNCRTMASNEGSVTNGPTSSATSNWSTISTGASPSGYNGEITDGDWGGSNGTGVNKLTLPFVGGGALPYEIIRRPPSGETSSSTLGASRLYNQAEIRILLSDDPADLCIGDSSCSTTDGGNIRLANVDNSATGGPDWRTGVPTTTMPQSGSTGSATTLPTVSGSTAYTTYFAEGSTTTPYPDSSNSCTGASSAPGYWSDWVNAPADPPTGYATLVPTSAPAAPLTVARQAGAAACLTVASSSITSSSSSTRNAFTGLPASPGYPYYNQPAANTINKWNLIDGYLRVEIRKSDGTYIPVTQEWLKLGFARGSSVPSGTGTNPINPKAILLLQKPADRNLDGTLDSVGAMKCTTSGNTKTCTAVPPELAKDGGVSTAADSLKYYGKNTDASPYSLTKNNWYPINFYDAREGEPRDSVRSNTTCYVEGLMNAVEIDVSNLKYWLANSTTGQTVDSSTQNGYILYFSDRRGMLKNPNGTSSDPSNSKTGDSGLEDSINASSSAGTPDGTLETAQSGLTLSPEDVNQNQHLDNWGAKNLGLGFFNSSTGNSLNSTITSSSTPNPYTTINSCNTTGYKNWVSGARHVLKLVDGQIISSSSSGLPTKPDGTGGFTVASENPVYIQGNYNTTGSADTTWSGGSDISGHAASAVIADAVTLLSTAWTELVSLNNPSDANSGPRPANTTYYRVAIAAGKSVNFDAPSYVTSTTYGFGTDGGLHNFLRFLEDWSNASLYYKGSLVSLYYSTYNTGTFKCCAYSVYQPPARNYSFDDDFSVYTGLPPGTPMFRDVENLTYHQVFTARTQ